MLSKSCFHLPLQDCEDHSILLCNLLLGFGLDAYVTIGTKTKGVAYSWVSNIAPTGEVVFWDSLTAERFAFFKLRLHTAINRADFVSW